MHPLLEIPDAYYAPFILAFLLAGFWILFGEPIRVTFFPRHPPLLENETLLLHHMATLAINRSTRETSRGMLYLTSERLIFRRDFVGFVTDRQIALPDVQRVSADRYGFLGVDGWAVTLQLSSFSCLILIEEWLSLALSYGSGRFAKVWAAAIESARLASPPTSRFTSTMRPYSPPKWAATVVLGLVAAPIVAFAIGTALLALRFI